MQVNPRIRQDSKLLKNYYENSEEDEQNQNSQNNLDDFFSLDEIFLINRFYEDPYQFSKERSIILIQLLFKLDHKDFDDFALFSILKYKLEDIERIHEEKKSILEIVYIDNLFEFCSAKGNYPITLRWLIETRPEDFQFYEQDCIESALENGRVENFQVLNIHNFNDSAFYHAFHSGNLEMVQYVFNIFPNFNFEEVNSALFKFAEKINDEDFILYVISKFVPELRTLTHLILKRIEIISLNTFILLISFHNLEDDFSAKISFFHSCCLYGKIEHAKYLYNLSNNVISENSIISAYMKNARILKWIYSVFSNKNLFEEILENVAIQKYSHDKNSYEFAFSLGINYKNLSSLFSSACQKDDLNIFQFLLTKIKIENFDAMFNAACQLNSLKVAQFLNQFNPNFLDSTLAILIHRKYDKMIKWLYEMGHIPDIYDQFYFEFACKNKSSTLSIWFLSFHSEVTESKKFQLFSSIILSLDSEKDKALDEALKIFGKPTEKIQDLAEISILNNNLKAFNLFYNEKENDNQKLFEDIIENNLRICRELYLKDFRKNIVHNLRILKRIYDSGEVKITKAIYQNALEFSTIESVKWIMSILGRKTTTKNIIYLKVETKFGFFDNNQANEEIVKLIDKYEIQFLLDNYEIEIPNIIQCYYKNRDSTAGLMLKNRFNFIMQE